MADADASNPIPQATRVVEGQSNKTLKHSVGKKKLQSNPSLAKLFYSNFILNGVQYCRPHLMIYCHLCEVNNDIVREQVDEEREDLGLKPGGDPALNRKAEYWANYIQEKQLEGTLKSDILRQMYGKGDKETFDRKWAEYISEESLQEREINERFLADVHATMIEGASQCCYYACNNNGNDNTKLFRCRGCGIAKYCCKDHQEKDWKWEHKGECTCNAPEFVKKTIEEDRQRNLRGDYTLSQS